MANGIIFHSQWVEAKENSKEKNKTLMTAQQSKIANIPYHRNSWNKRMN